MKYTLAAITFGIIMVVIALFSPEITGKTTDEYFPGHKDPECSKDAIEQHASICNDLLEETKVKNCINARFLYCNLSS